MVLVTGRIELRPAARGILGQQDVPEALEKCLFILFVFGKSKYLGQKPQFSDCGTVIKGSLQRIGITGEY